ncbi:MAG: ATP-binding cassette domain-containing protein, partial [Coprococcus eutactus]|nr:ATP-binding cassette domain-containing protein [Coprococcus eutactus]
MAILLETKNLSKEYHNVKAVDSISISMEEGHIYGIIGPNGAGKTT